MQGNRSRDTAPERAVRSKLHARGLRFRVSMRPVPAFRCTADVVFTRARLAVFIDGCYWHGCPIHGREPRTNQHYWRAKLARNRARDLRQTDELTRHGWTVLRFWEHEDPDGVAGAIQAALATIMQPRA